MKCSSLKCHNRTSFHRYTTLELKPNVTYCEVKVLNHRLFLKRWWMLLSVLHFIKHNAACLLFVLQVLRERFLMMLDVVVACGMWM